MGGKSSKRATQGRYSSFESKPAPWSHHGYPQSPYGQPSQTYAPMPPSQSCGGGQAPGIKRKLERKYSKIDDDYNSLEQVSIYIYIFWFR